MIRKGISYEDVIQAADTLRAQGETPTIERIRHILGGTGSNTTISKYLNEWRQQTTRMQATTPPDTVQTAVQRVWQQLREETDIEINQVKEESLRLIHDAIEREKLALKQADEQAEKLTVLREQFHALQGAKELLTLDFKKLQTEHALLNERYLGLEERYNEFRRMTERHEEQRSHDHQKAMDMLLQKSQQQDTLHQQIISELKHHNENQRQQFMVEMDALKTQHQQLKKSLTDAENKIIMKEALCIQTETQLTSVIQERNHLLAELEERNKQWASFYETKEIITTISAEINKIPKENYASLIMNYCTEISKDLAILFQQSNDIKPCLEKLTHQINLLSIECEKYVDA